MAVRGKPTKVGQLKKKNSPKPNEQEREGYLLQRMRRRCVYPSSNASFQSVFVPLTRFPDSSDGSTLSSHRLNVISSTPFNFASSLKLMSFCSHSSTAIMQGFLQESKRGFATRPASAVRKHSEGPKSGTRRIIQRNSSTSSFKKTLNPSSSNTQANEEALRALKHLVEAKQTEIPVRTFRVSFFSDAQRKAAEVVNDEEDEKCLTFTNTIRESIQFDGLAPTNSENVQSKEGGRRKSSSNRTKAGKEEREEEYYKAFQNSPLLSGLNKQCSPLSVSEKRKLYEDLFSDDRKRLGLEFEKGMQLIEEAAAQSYDANTTIKQLKTKGDHNASPSSLEFDLHQRLRQKYIEAQKLRAVKRERQFQQLEAMPKKHPLMALLVERRTSFRVIFPEYRNSADHIVRTIEKREPESVSLVEILDKYAPHTRTGAKNGSAIEAQMFALTTTGYLGERNTAIKKAEEASIAKGKRGDNKKLVPLFEREPFGRVRLIPSSARSFSRSKDLMTSKAYRGVQPTPNELWPSFFNTSSVKSKKVELELLRRTKSIVSDAFRLEADGETFLIDYMAPSRIGITQIPDPSTDKFLRLGISSFLNHDLRIRSAEDLLQRSQIKNSAAAQQVQALREENEGLAFRGRGEELGLRLGKERRVLPPYMVEALIANKSALSAKAKEIIRKITKIEERYGITRQQKCERIQNNALCYLLDVGRRKRCFCTQVALPRHAVEHLVSKKIAPPNWLDRFKSIETSSKSVKMNVPGVPEPYMIHDDALLTWPLAE